MIRLPRVNMDPCQALLRTGLETRVSALQTQKQSRIHVYATSIHHGLLCPLSELDEIPAALLD